MSASPSPRPGRMSGPESRSGFDSTPTGEAVRSPAWIATLLVLLGVLAFVYAPLLAYCFDQWLKPDYSHGFLVPFFALFLACYWREWAPRRIKWPDPWGLAFLAVGYGLFKVVDIYNVAKEWLQGLSLVLCLCGGTLLLGGWSALRWLAPSLAFLLFMFPLPYRVEHALGGKLQTVAAIASEFTLQTIGYPTYREGNVLHAKDHILEVEKACSGLSMLLTFVAISVGVALLVKRPWFDRILILASSVPIAILSNVIRIALTGVLYNEGGKELGDQVFHRFAGWMMMPIALVLLWAELKLLDWVWVDVGGKASHGDVMKVNAQPAHLIMTALPVGKGAAPAKPASLPVPNAPAPDAPTPPKGAPR